MKPGKKAPKKRIRIQTEQRKEQNRSNQRAFRQRREHYVKELESAHENIKELVHHQREEIDHLRGCLKNVNMPGQNANAPPAIADTTSDTGQSISLTALESLNVEVPQSELARAPAQSLPQADKIHDFSASTSLSASRPNEYVKPLSDSHAASCNAGSHQLPLAFPQSLVKQDTSDRWGGSQSTPDKAHSLSTSSTESRTGRIAPDGALPMLKQLSQITVASQDELTMSPKTQTWVAVRPSTLPNETSDDHRTGLPAPPHQEVDSARSSCIGVGDMAQWLQKSYQPSQMQLTLPAEKECRTQRNNVQELCAQSEAWTTVQSPSWGGSIDGDRDVTSLDALQLLGQPVTPFPSLTSPSCNDYVSAM